MRCNSSGGKGVPWCLDPFNKDTTVFSFVMTSRRKPGRCALHARTASLFITGHDAIGHGDISNFPSLRQLFLVL